MAKIVMFCREDVRQIQQQDRDVVDNADFNSEHYAAFEKQKHSYSVIIDGKVVACCGVVELWKGRGEAWALIDRNSKTHFVEIFKAFQKILAGIECRRIEAVVRCDFPQGKRLVEMLGFKVEAQQMKNYGFTGEDCALYARVG